MLAKQVSSLLWGNRVPWDRYSMDAVFTVLWLREQWGARVAVWDLQFGIVCWHVVVEGEQS